TRGDGLAVGLRGGVGVAPRREREEPAAAERERARDGGLLRNDADGDRDRCGDLERLVVAAAVLLGALGLGRLVGAGVGVRGAVRGGGRVRVAALVGDLRVDGLPCRVIRRILRGRARGARGR